MPDSKSLQAFGRIIQSLLQKGDLSAETAAGAFRELLTGTQPDLHQGAFLAALAAKGETVDEISGAWKAIMECDTVVVTDSLPEVRVENSGTGMDALKTFNVSSAAAVVAAACGATMTRHGARALTSSCGTVDILESIGLDVECPASVVAGSIRKTGIGLFNGMSPRVHPGGLGRILSRIRFGSTLNIAASLANPARPTHAVRGVWHPDLLEKAALLMPSMGIRRGLVVHGLDARHPGGMDEMSVAGDTLMADFEVGRDTRFHRFQLEEAGMKPYPFEAIAALGHPDREKIRFLAVLKGTGDEPCTAFTCLNAAAVLLTTGHATSWTEGIGQAHRVIRQGQALAKLREWVAVQNTAPEKGLAILDRHLEAVA